MVRWQYFLALSLLLLGAGAARSQQGSSLQEADRILAAARVPATSNLTVGYLSEPAISLVGTEWVGTARNSTNGKEYPWQVYFATKDRCVIGSSRTVQGGWSLSGQTLRLRGDDATNDLNLAISGDTMSGRFLSNDGQTIYVIEIRKK